MVDEDWLDDIDFKRRDVVALTGSKDRYELRLEHDYAVELIRLARLGLWAEKHAIPEMKKCVDDRHYGGCYPRHTEALSALPKDVK